MCVPIASKLWIVKKVDGHAFIEQTLNWTSFVV